MSRRLESWLTFQLGWFGANLYHAWVDHSVSAILVAILVLLTMGVVGLIYDRYRIVRRIEASETSQETP